VGQKVVLVATLVAIVALVAVGFLHRDFAAAGFWIGAGVGAGLALTFYVVHWLVGIVDRLKDDA
jgi:uncharacterized membrane protein